MKYSSLGAMALIAVSLSCSDETTVYDTKNDTLLLEDSQAVLEKSIVYDNSGVLDIFEEDGTSGKFSRTAKADDVAGDYPLTLVAQIDPPSFAGGENLTATDVHLDGNYAYVSYNTAGSVYTGALDIVNISDPNNPYLSSRAYSYDKDLNAVHYNSGYVYIVGGIDAEKSVTATANSVIIRVAANSGSIDTSDLTYLYQDGFNATDVEVNDNSIFVTSGKDGYIIQYNKSSLDIVNEAPFTDLRSLTLQNDKIAVLDASVGVRVLNSDLSESSQISITSGFGEAEKRTLDFYGDNIVVSEGSKGAGVYNASTGDLLEYIPILLSPDGVDQANIVTNAVATNEDVLLMANGGGGLCLSEDQGNNTDLVGVIELNGSINYVESKGDYIFAASGKSGLQVIKLNRPDESLAARCATLPAYSGSRILEVLQGETKEYRGAKRFNKINVSGSLLLCGSWTTSNSNIINSDGLFEMNGNLIVGRNNKRKNITVDENATLRIEGNLIIYGDLILNDGATIEFIGENSTANIFGSVKRTGDVEVKGTFDDIRNKF